MYLPNSRGPPSRRLKSWVRSKPVLPYGAHWPIAYVEVVSPFGKRKLKNYAGMADLSAMKFDVRGVTETIQRALASAGLDTQSGLAHGIMETINGSLTMAGFMDASETAVGGTTIDGTAHEVDPTIAVDDARTARAANDPVAQPLDEESSRTGEFLRGSFANAAGTRTYKVYVPASR